MIIGTRYSLIVSKSTITHLRVDNAILDICNNYNELSGPNVYMGIINVLINNPHYFECNSCCSTPAIINVFSTSFYITTKPYSKHQYVHQ